MGIYDDELRYDLVDQARLCYEALADFRRRRARSRNYFRNRPDETVKDEDGFIVKEDDLIRDQGRIPLHLSRIGKLIKNLQGQYRNINMQRMAYGRNREDNDAADQMSEALRAANDVNETQELDARMILEMLMSGLYGWKTTYTWLPRFNRQDVYVQNLDTTRLFFNPDFTDIRTHDINICGEIHDASMDEILTQFALDDNGNYSFEAEQKIRKFCIDSREWADRAAAYTVGFPSRDTQDFFNTSDPRKNRIIEIWKLEYGVKNFLQDTATGTCEESDITPDQIELLNLMRQKEAKDLGLTPPPPIIQFPRYGPTWNVYFLTVMGNVLYHKQTPYWHENDPYTLGFAEYVDGEIWGPLEEMIEPQRHINRINSAIDYALGAAAKGVLMVPEDCIPDGMTLDDFASEWTRFGGVIKFKAKPGGKLPTQIKANMIPEGIFQWLENMYRDLREMSGVQQANMGTAPPQGTPASSYMAQIQQGQTTNREYFDAFFAVRRRRDLKMVQVIAQFYDEVRHIAVSGKRADNSKYVTYDPSRVRGIEWEIQVTEASDTPATRQQMEDYLLNFLNTNRITFGQYLQMSSHPKADLIMNIIQKTNPLLAESKVGMQQYQALMAQTQQQAQAGNQDAIAMLQQAQ
jgi:hypothetical protein